MVEIPEHQSIGTPDFPNHLISSEENNHPASSSQSLSDQKEPPDNQGQNLATHSPQAESNSDSKIPDDSISSSSSASVQNIKKS
jgi:hypothetical protein